MKFEFRGTQSCRNRREEAFGRGLKEKTGRWSCPESGFIKSMTAGDNGKMSGLMDFNTGLTDAEAEKKTFFASSRR